jgi:hypothetical protein
LGAREQRNERGTAPAENIEIVRAGDGAFMKGDLTTLGDQAGAGA